MGKKIISLLFLSILVLTSFSGAEEFTDPQKNISINIPTDWKQVSGPEGTFLTLQKEKDGVRSFLLFFINKTDQKDTDLASLTKEEREKLIDSEKTLLQSTTSTKVEILSIDVKKLGNRDFLVSRISLPDKGLKSARTTFTKSLIFYSISLLTNNKEDGFDSDLNEILKSIRFLK